MKFRVTMKDPDTLSDAIHDAVMAELEKLDGIDKDERDTLADGRCQAAAEIAGTWFEYGEYLTVEIDTDAKTATVIPRT